MRRVDLITSALESHAGTSTSWLVGEPCFDPPAELVEALAQAARMPNSKYPPHEGLPELRRVLAQHHSARGSSVAPAQVVVTSGAKGALLALLATILEPGDELIHPAPWYPAYPLMATRFGARPLAVPESGPDFEGWAAAVAPLIGPRTRAVVIASPSNPTGSTLSPAAAAELVELCRARGIRLICDEAYVDFRFTSGDENLPTDYDPDRTTVVQVRSASKSWALCGWRVGWLVADAPLVARVARTHASLVNPASRPAQTALCSLPEIPPEYVESARAAVHARMRALCDSLENAGFAFDAPNGGFYLWLDVADLCAAAGFDDVTDWCIDLAHHLGIGLWPGHDFGGTRHVRLAVTSPSDSDWPAALKTLQEVLALRS